MQRKIKLWQNDSEPNNPIYWNGTDDEFISELKIFYKADQPANAYSLPGDTKLAKATDVFSKNIPVKISKHQLQIDVSNTPVFIEAGK